MQYLLIEGKIWKQILKFFFPILIGTFFQQLYNTVDTIIVGQYVGTTALAAVGSTGNLISLLVNFFVGLSSGTTVLIAQFYAANKEHQVFKTVHTSFALALFCGIFMTFFGLFFSKQCLDVMGVPLDILDASTLYLRLYFLGIIPLVIYNIGTSILRAIGDSRTPLIYLIICTFINIVLDYVFIVYFYMGIAGAGIATSIAQLISALLVCHKLMHTTKCYRLSIKKISFDIDILKNILKIGIPAGLQSIMYSVSNIILQIKINSFGTSMIAAWTVYCKIDALFFMVAEAFSSALMTFVGQNYGVKHFSRVRQGMKTCIGMLSISAILLSVLLMSFGQHISLLFSSDEMVINETIQIIHLIVPYYITYSAAEIISATMRGCGDSIKPMILVCCGICLLRILWVIVMPLIYDSFNIVIICYPISWTVTSLFFIVYYQIFKKCFLKSV